MFNYNEPTEVVLGFQLIYKSLKKDVSKTHDSLIKHCFPLIPTYTDSYLHGVGEWVTFSFRFLFDIAQFETTLNILLEVLIANRNIIKSQGLGCYLSDFEIFINYRVSTSVLLKHSQLQLINDIHRHIGGDASFTSISLNSSRISKGNENPDISGFEDVDDNDCGEYYQLIFYTQSDEAKQDLIDSWNNTFYYKYALYQYWGYESGATFSTSPYIVLSVKTEIVNKLVEGSEMLNDFLYFIKQNQHIDSRISKIVFGGYYCNYDGGEIGYSTISSLIDLGIDLLITRSIRTPFV